MDGRTLSKLTGHITLARCNALIPGLYEAWRIADVNTVLRRAGWFSQVLEETGGLQWTTELASGAEYNGRTDLGNTQPGDGERFKGRGFIQLTGRNNYAAFSRWCHAHGLVPNDHYFLDHPEQVANDRFAWLSAAFYWVGNHNHGYDYLNKAADARDLVAMTYMVNGAQNGFETRQYYYNRALALGNELMTPVHPGDPNWSDVMDEATFNEHVDARLRKLMHGDDKLHHTHPAIYGGTGHGVDDRLEDHAKRLVTLEKKAGI